MKSNRTLRRSILVLVVLLAACSRSDRQPPTAPPIPKSSTAPGVEVAEAATATKSAPAASQPAPQPAPKMAPTPAVTTRDTELKEKPFVDAKTLKKLPRNTTVAIVDRNGGWLNVTSGGAQGWVRLLHVSSQPPGSSAAGAEEMKSAVKMATGRAGGGNIVATTGIRGLSEEQLREAKPNPEEEQRLEGYAVSAARAGDYAHANKLERRQVPYLPAPG
ncbi:MAG: hypothetical protein ACJ8NR_02560 [Sulfurifustis sp.]